MEEPITKYEALKPYDTHKKVNAGKIASIAQVPETPSLWRLEIEGGGYVDVGGEYMAKFNPQVGGYFVQYKDGYISFCPGTVFEEDATLSE